jgi:hypothetical protein
MPYEAAPPPSLGGIRVANFSNTAPPVDFCFAPHGTTQWKGPMLAAASTEDTGTQDVGGASAPGFTFSDAGVAGLGFPGVTRYFYLAPGRYDARFVTPGSADCNEPVVKPDATTLPALAKDGLVTIALFADIAGDAGADAGSARSMVTAFQDDTAVPASVGPGRIGIRFINAAPTVLTAGLGYIAPAFSADGGQTGPGSVYESLFSGVAYGHTSPPSDNVLQPLIDDGGYTFPPASHFAPGASSTNLTIAVLTEAALDAVNEHSVPVAQGPTTAVVGIIFTVVLLVPSPGWPASDGGSEGGALALLQCTDNGGPSGLAGPCSLISQ